MLDDISPAQLERYLVKVDRRGPDECWPWNAATNSQGYGWFRTPDRPELAHRFGYAAMVGPIPAGLVVCHRCDNPPCNNPAHWFLGTRASNNADREAKGRGVNFSGEENGASKLRAEQVLEIRTRYAKGDISQAKLGSEYGVTKTLIRYIVHRRIWKTI